MIGKMTPKLTAFYDCFINSTFLSRHISLADLSFYIVSFPGREITETMRKGYIFLHNSDYTSEWAYKYWDEHRSQIIYPVLGEMSKDNKEHSGFLEKYSSDADKEKLIISVGRYNYSGHCKNQHLIVRTFVDLLKVEPKLCDWRLRIMGSVDFSSDFSREHFDECLRLANGNPNIEVLGNVSPDLISTSYESASLYVHAAGLGADLVAEPDKAEHFGIAVYDGLANGCICLVFGEGGPAHMVKKLDGAMVFNSHSEMSATMKTAMHCVEDRELFSFLSMQSRKRAESLKDSSKLSIDKIIDLVQIGEV